MKWLNYLTVRYHEICFDDIYTQCISLRTLIFANVFGVDHFNKFGKMIELVKQSQIPRSSPLTIVFVSVNIKTAVKAMKKVQQDGVVG